MMGHNQTSGNVATPASQSQQDYPGTELHAMATAINYHHWIVDSFEPYLGRVVAEVGAGIGSVSKLLLKASVERLVSFEPSPNMFPSLNRELQDEPKAQAINSFLDPEYLGSGADSAVYINVMEHIEDDRGEMKNAYSALRPGGHLLVFVPALAWLYSDFDRHVGHFRRYKKSGLADLARSVGFEVRKIKYFDVVGIIPWYVSFKLLRGHPKSNSVGLYDNFVVPPMRRIESLITPPIGKSLMLVARKPT